MHASFLPVEGLEASRQAVTLIGMPGVGKSTVGILLAKASQRSFVDTDVVIQSTTGRSLQAIIDEDGLDVFMRMEEAVVLDLPPASGGVIATGGSVVYSDRAMRHLKSVGPVVALNLPIDMLERRVSDLAGRGVVMPKGWTLRQLERERAPLYRRWADLTVEAAGKSQDQLVAEILEVLKRP